MTPISKNVITGLSLALALMMSGCYKHTMRTGLPSSGQTHSSKVTHYFFGMAGGGSKDFQSQCPNGIAEVSEQKGAADAIISALTLYLYTPLSVEVTCAELSASR